MAFENEVKNIHGHAYGTYTAGRKKAFAYRT